MNIYEHPDPLDKSKPDDIPVEIFVEDNSDPTDKTSLKDILKRMSSNRKSKKYNGGKNNGNKSQRSSRSGNERRK